jgi:hypothetical protein
MSTARTQNETLVVTADPRTAGASYAPGDIVMYGTTPLIARSWGAGDLVDLRTPLSQGLSESAKRFAQLVQKVDPTGQSLWGWSWVDAQNPRAVGTKLTNDGTVTWTETYAALNSGTTSGSIAQIGFATDTSPVALAIASHTTGSTTVVYGMVARFAFPGAPSNATTAYVGLSNAALNKYMRVGVDGTVSTSTAYVTCDNNTAGNFSLGVDVTAGMAEKTFMVYRTGGTFYAYVDDVFVASNTVTCATAATGWTAVATNGVDEETVGALNLKWAGILYKIE